ncbi:DUF2059 domain-containing protein [Salinisphaera sp. Q1T1-3]|uniref:DUF2059 domain-containing protein n=1 Tax=Salinisphaera sp. Q1T1-3 TaxID=2321229 RepID=UPI000E719198|nr:DUF2059 domain-containing protein [Salinisphaera sp. Q1T1-3]RJS94339.1 DUF2059 domain-containing protein [Salinisphaera sp. Q1T1-3]
MTTSARQKRLDRLIAATALSILCSVAPGWAAASGEGSDPSSPAATSPQAGDQPADVQASKDALVHTLVRLTDRAQLQNVFTDQFIDRVTSAMSLFGGSLDEATLQAIQQQTRAVVSERIADGDALYTVLAPIYEKHFNLIELNQLVNFYQSPLGQKLVRISPQLLTESLDLGQQWGLSLVPEIVSRVRAQRRGEPMPQREPEEAY